MSNFLQTVLEIDDPLFKAGLMSLEKSTGDSAVDVKLIVDITEKSHKVMRHLGLDTSDTTGNEMYMALNAAVKRDDIEDLLDDCDYVLSVFDGRVISFNLIDIIENSHHELPFEKNIISHGKRSLMGELVERYVNHPRTDEQAVRELADSIGLSS